MEERAIDRLRKFARYARDKGVVKGENSFEAYCELSNRYIYNSIRNGKGAIGTDISHCMMIGYMLKAIHSRQYITIINVTNVISTRP